METVPALIAICRADSQLRKLCAKRMHQNQAPSAYVDPAELDLKGYPAFFVVTRRAANSDDVLHPDDQPAEPDEELLEVEIAAGDPETVEKIVARLRALFHGRQPVLGARTAGYVEVRDQDEGWTAREELIEQGFDVASVQIGIYF